MQGQAALEKLTFKLKCGSGFAKGQANSGPIICSVLQRIMLESSITPGRD